MTDRHARNKAALSALRGAQYDWDPDAIRAALDRVAAPGAVFRMCHPFGDLAGPGAFFDAALAPLAAAWPDVERRDWLVMAGTDADGADWVGSGGHFLGTFAAPLLGIPPTGHIAHMRFHEFYRFDGDRVAEVQAIWDLPEVMVEAGAWPMAPSLGRELAVPGPASGDGLARAPRDAAESARSLDTIRGMLAAMSRHPSEGGPAVMEMPRYWHPRMNWYGPAGIGTGRGIAGFRHWHQIPFLDAMPDRGRNRQATAAHFFADNAYIGVTGWPNMRQTLSAGGWLGIAPAGREITLRSLDFWRLEAGRIRENWVLVDLLDIHRQLGVDVLARLAEFNKSRVPGAVPFPVGGPE